MTSVAFSLRANRTLDRLTQRLTAIGIIEDVLSIVRGDAAGAGFYDGALVAFRRNPVTVLMMCLGAVMLFSGIHSQEDFPRSTAGSERERSRHPLSLVAAFKGTSGNPPLFDIMTAKLTEFRPSGLGMARHLALF
ncbi:hypothetical protein MKK68_03530 [Methylobacterium sp. E-016]|uniref:hypothetical protein n=1 Tax=Methylobacterium sp. E-016 TaxID=2836556 RepID=UPI001FBAF509|nr:hypothetical protein [Methylobacterium sp. E-016]MCJ2074726.1 hypothetical protein [Methylobacterium sp. E-016]